jgi:hypothetical protein
MCHDSAAKLIFRNRLNFLWQKRYPLHFNLEPIYAIILAFVFFNEGKEMNNSFYLGLFFVMTSVVLQTIISLRKKK